MEAKDGSFGFDMGGKYTEIKIHSLLAYHMPDDREVRIRFTVQEKMVEITEVFDAEGVNSVEKQKAGWQAILNNFKLYTETH